MLATSLYNGLLKLQSDLEIMLWLLFYYGDYCPLLPVLKLYSQVPVAITATHSSPGPVKTTNKKGRTKIRPALP